MDTSCYNPTLQTPHASTLSKEPQISTKPGQAESFEPSRTTKFLFRKSLKTFRSYKRPRKTHTKILGPLSSHTTLAAHQAAIAASPLLCLSGEIRNMIYAYALTSEKRLLAYDVQHGRFDISGIGAGLLQTCHMVSRETIYLPLLLNTLVFGSPTGSGENEERMLRCIGKVIKLWREIGLKGGADIKFLSQKEIVLTYSK